MMMERFAVTLFIAGDLRSPRELDAIMRGETCDPSPLRESRVWTFLTLESKDGKEIYYIKNFNLVYVFQLKKLVYVYLVRYAEEQQDLALLSISTFQRALKVSPAHDIQLCPAHHAHLPFLPFPNQS